VNPQKTTWLILPLIALLCAGCSTDNSTSSKGQTDAIKPPPQVRVMALPSATATLVPPEETVTPTIEPSATPAEAYTFPTPDEDAIVGQIDAMIEDINRKLNSQDLLLKP
jgi:hypothetical protein